MLNGTLPVRLRDIMTMRATQKNRMSCPVSIASVGKYLHQGYSLLSQPRQDTHPALGCMYLAWAQSMLCKSADNLTSSPQQSPVVMVKRLRQRA